MNSGQRSALVTLLAWLVLDLRANAVDILDAGSLRLGSGNEDSFDAVGNVRQPYYRNSLGTYVPLMSENSSTLQLGLSFNGQQYSPVNGSVSVSGSSGTIVQDLGPVRLTRTYTLYPLGFETAFRACALADVSQAEFWYGADADVIDSTVATKEIGKLDSGNAFVPAVVTSDGSVVQLSTPSAVVYLASSIAGARAIVNGPGSFETTIQGQTSGSHTSLSTDGTYGMYVNLGSWTSGTCKQFSIWYSAAAKENIALAQAFIAPNIGTSTTTTMTTSTTNTTTTDADNMTAGTVGSDPLTYYGSESREFFLPVGKLVPVLYTRELTMLASTFPGSPYEQWFGRVVVNNADGFRLADIRIKKDIASANRTKLPANPFETLDVTFGGARAPMASMPNEGHYWLRMGVHITVSKLTNLFWNSGASGPRIDQLYIGGKRRELVMIKCASARILVFSSPATEYFGTRADLTVSYAHLDIVILDMKDRASVRGIFPELWGFRKMSNKTRALLTPPWQQTTIDGTTPEGFGRKSSDDTIEFSV